MGIEAVVKNHLEPPKAIFLPQKFGNLRPKTSKSFIRFSISYVILMPFAWYLYVLIFCLHVLVCHSFVSRMYSYVIRMSLIYTRMSSACHSYVLVCHPCVTYIYLYVIRLSLVCCFTMNRLKIILLDFMFSDFSKSLSE